MSFLITLKYQQYLAPYLILNCQSYIFYFAIIINSLIFIITIFLSNYGKKTGRISDITKRILAIFDNFDP